MSFFPWLANIAKCALTSIIFLGLSLAVLVFLEYRIIHGIGDSFVVVAVFVASFTATHTYLSKLRAYLDSSKNNPIGSPPLVIGISLVIASLCCVGGGLTRNLITDSSPILIGPTDFLWVTISGGWLFAFLLHSIDKVRLSQNFDQLFVNLDSWAIGVFAVIGMYASYKWNLGHPTRSHLVIQIITAGCFAGITGAAGGLFADIFSHFFFSNRVKNIYGSLKSWLFAYYFGICFSTGVFAFIVMSILFHYFKPVVISEADFYAKSITISDFIKLAAFPDLTGLSKIGEQITASDRGIITALYFLFGIATCYKYRAPLLRQWGTRTGGSPSNHNS